MSSPCPMSILPKKASTRPSGRIAIQESSSVGTSGGLPACAKEAEPGTAKETTSAPDVLKNSRRESMGGLLGHLGLGALDRAQDRHMRAAAAFQAGKRVAQLRVRSFWIFLQHRRRSHDPAVHAVAALRHLLGDVRGLQRVRLLRRAEALDRG